MSFLLITVLTLLNLIPGLTVATGTAALYFGVAGTALTLSSLCSSRAAKRGGAHCGYDTSKNKFVYTVAKYVAELEEHGLIRTERTEVMTRGGLKRNGCLRYTILPIQNAVELFHQRQLEDLSQAEAQLKAREKAKKMGVTFTPAAEKETPPCRAL